VVDLPKLRGSLDRTKGISPQLRGRAYYDNEYFEVSKSIINKCSWSCKKKNKFEDVFGVVEEMKEEESFRQIIYNLMMKEAS